MSNEELPVLSDSGRIEDIDKALAGALAEKPIRDLAREEGVSEEEKAILDRLAARRGEKALQEYDAEKETNPVERLKTRIKEIALKMKENSLEEDAIIMEKIEGRLRRFIVAINTEKEKLENSHGKKVKITQLVEARNRDFTLPVSHRVGASGEGGCIYLPDGRMIRDSGFVDETKSRIIRDKVDELNRKGKNLEIVDYSLSGKGKTEFFRALGVLRPDEDSVELPEIYLKAHNAEMESRNLPTQNQIFPKNYTALFPTNIQGVGVYIRKSPGDKAWSESGEEEEVIGLKFDRDFLDTLFSQTG